MNIKWYDKNNDIFDSKMSSTGQMIKKLLDGNDEKNLQTVNLIFEDEALLTQFIKSCSALNGDFNSISFRLGVKLDNNMDTISSEVIDSNIIYFGGNKSENRYLTVFNKDCVHINNKCEECPNIGYQRHLEQTISMQSISLGELKMNFDTAESLLRSKKSVIFNPSSVSLKDSNNMSSQSIGLDIYEVCQLLRYAGLSENCDFLFVNVEGNSENLPFWNFTSVVCWYYMEGLNYKFKESIDDDVNTYLVENEYYDAPIEFTESKVTKRWWCIHPENKKKIACTRKDYESISNGDIPDFLMTELFENT